MKEKKEKKSKEPKQKLTKEEKIEQKGNFGERFSLKFRKKLVANRARTILLVLVLIVLFITLNAWARTKATAQIDLTENKIYTLSQTSKDQLNSLDKEVMIYIYGYDDTNEYVTFIKQYAEYNDNIKYEIVTTESNYEVINKYNLDSDGIPAIVVVCGDRDVTLHPDYDFSSYDYVNGSYTTVDLTEQSITNAILNVSADDPTKVYFVTGHGEYVTDYVTEMVTSLEDLVYECNEINLFSSAEIPEDCDILVFLNPQSDISPELAEKLKSYVNNGGNLVVYWYKSDPDTDFTNFQGVLDLYGAGVEYGLLYEGNSSNYYYYPYYLIPEASSSSEITADIATGGYVTLLSFAQRVLTNDVSEDNISVSTEKLLYTSNSCYNITDEDTINQGLSLDGVEQGSYTVAQKYTRSVSTSDSDDAETTQSNLILVGCSNFVLDNGFYSSSSGTANESFVLNSFASLAGENDLITVQKYSSESTAFTKTPTAFADAVVKLIIFGLPVLIILVGIIIWIVRRRKR